jgi:hypothetical protein
MIVLFTMTWPATSTIEMAKAGAKNFQENPWPDSMRLNGPFYVAYEDGMKCYALFEIDKGKDDEVFKVFNKRLAIYLTVPGFGSKAEILMTMEEAYPLLNMEVPKR